MQKNPTQHKNDKKKSRSFSLFKPRDRQPNYILSVLCTTVALLLVVVLVMGMGGFGLVMGVAKAYYDTTPELDVEKIETQNLTSFIYDCNGDLITASSSSAPLPRRHAVIHSAAQSAGSMLFAVSIPCCAPRRNAP